MAEVEKRNLALTLHRTAWAGAGDGVLFIDADGDGKISNLAEYVFTEWDRSASDDMEAMRRVFDTDGDGKLTEADARWGEFRVMVAADCVDVIGNRAKAKDSICAEAILMQTANIWVASDLFMKMGRNRSNLGCQL